VAQVFYEEKNIQRIIDYCERDVIAVAQILLKFNKLPLLSETSILSIKDA
jgi:hypothetical protein